MHSQFKLTEQTCEKIASRLCRQASSLQYSDLRSPEVSRQIAHQLATVHSLNVPICKEPRFIWQMMKK